MSLSPQVRWIVADTTARDQIAVGVQDIGFFVKVLAGSGSLYQAEKAGTGSGVWADGFGSIVPGFTVTGAIRQTPTQFPFSTSVSLAVNTNNSFQMTDPVTADWNLTLTGGQDGDCGTILFKQGGGHAILSVTAAGRVNGVDATNPTLNTADTIAAGAWCILTYAFSTAVNSIVSLGIQALSTLTVATDLPSIVGSSLKQDLDSRFIAADRSSWPDQSTFGNNLAQATSGLRPTIAASVIDGKPAVRFNGSQWMSGAFSGIAGTVIGVSYGATLRMYVIASATALADHQWIYALSLAGASNTGETINLLSTGQVRGSVKITNGANNVSAFQEPGADPGDTTALALYDVLVEGTGVYVRAGNAALASYVAANTYPWDAPSQCDVGVLPSHGSFFLTGDIVRAFVVSPAPDITSHGQIIAYLRATYPSLPLA